MRTIEPGPPAAPHFYFVRAQPSDADTLTAIALAAKRYWGYPEEWMEAWRMALTITPAFIQQHDVYGARIAGDLAGFYALVPTAHGMVLEHLWVRPALIGRRIGRALFLHASERSRRLGQQRLLITADPNAQGFYEKMGARWIGEEHAPVLGQPRVLPVLALDL